MKRAPFFVALVALAAPLGGCSSLSQPDEIRVVKDVPAPPKPLAAPAGPAAPQAQMGGAGLPALNQPAGRKAAGKG
jgi:hypothetical protein